MLITILLLAAVVTLLVWVTSKPVGDQHRPFTKDQPKTGKTDRDWIEDLREVQVAYVLDGDTIVASTFWDEFRVRLDSIDCPEDGQEWGETARDGLIKMIGGRHVRIEEHGEDIHGRTLATIYVRIVEEGRWMNVNERMVTLGHAWVMRKYYGHLSEERKNQLNRLEQWAKNKRVGLWKTANPVPPWVWRRKVRESED